MYNILKRFCLMVVITAVLTHHCEGNKNLTMVFGTSSGKIWLSKSNQQPEEATKLLDFANEVSDFVVFNNYLYISIKVHTFINRDSSIFRCAITDSTDFTINTRCQDFNDVMLHGESILSMVVAKGYIFAGRTDGIIWRCYADLPHRCETYEKEGSEIIGIDYHSESSRLYASWSSGSLWRCLPYSKNSCVNVFSSPDYEFTSMRVAFDAVWIGTDEGELLKCPLGDENEKIMCSSWNTFTNNSVLSIRALDGYLYANLDSDTMWKCDPNESSSCKIIFSTPSRSGPFIIV